MQDRKSNINIEIIPQDNIIGSSKYTLTVKITNNSNEVIKDLDVNTNLIIGREISKSDDIESSSIDILEEKKRKLIKELEQQVKNAYQKNKTKEMSSNEKLLYAFAEALEFYASLFSRERNSVIFPSWTNEVFKIDEWDDVERLEKEFILLLDDDSFLKKSFLINKQKLSRVLKKLGKENDKSGNNRGDLSSGINLSVGETISFPFIFKAPHLLKVMKSNVQFRITYKLNNNDQQILSSIHKKITVYPSAFAVPTGGMLGASAGYFIRSTLLSTSEFSMDWSVFAGSLLLGLVISLLTSRKPETTKAITVEDFVGGFIIGSFSGLFSEVIIQKLRTIIS